MKYFYGLRGLYCFRQTEIDIFSFDTKVTNLFSVMLVNSQASIFSINKRKIFFSLNALNQKICC